MKIPVPVKCLGDQSKLTPGIWSEVDRIIHNLKYADVPGGRKINWPNWSFCPFEVVFGILGLDENPTEASMLVRTNALCLAAWRATQGIYMIDKDVLSELWESTIDGHVPVSTLQCLPEWCCYVESSGVEWLGHKLDGFFVSVFWSEEAPVLILSAHSGSKWVGILTVRLDPRKTLLECIAESSSDFSKNKLSDVELKRIAEPLVSVALYLCTAADRPAVPRLELVTGRKGKPTRFSTPDKPAVYEMGVRIGAELRAARLRAETESAGLGSRKIGHVRRAHWHTYLIGPGRAATEVKWLSPILVNLARENVSPVIRPVNP